MLYHCNDKCKLRRSSAAQILKWHSTSGQMEQNGRFVNIQSNSGRSLGRFIAIGIHHTLESVSLPAYNVD